MVCSIIWYEVIFALSSYNIIASNIKVLMQILHNADKDVLLTNGNL